MGVINLAPYKPVPGTVGDANAIANAFTSLEAVLNGGIDSNNFAAGLIFNPNKIMQGGATTGQVLAWNGAAWAAANGVGWKDVVATYGGDLVAACAAAVAGDVLYIRSNINLAALALVPDGVDLVGAGKKAATITCTAAAARVQFGPLASAGPGSWGGRSGGFAIDGANIATNPLLIGLSVQRTFQDINVRRAAQDNIVLKYGQNNTFIAVDNDRSARYGLVLDLGCGGNEFIRCESDSNATANLKITQSASSAGGNVYVTPTDNHFQHCIFERFLAAGPFVAAVDIDSGIDNYFLAGNFSLSAIGVDRPLARFRNDLNGFGGNPNRYHFDNCLWFGDVGPLCQAIDAPGNVTIYMGGVNVFQTLKTAYYLGDNAFIRGAQATFINVTNRFLNNGGVAPAENLIREERYWPLQHSHVGGAEKTTENTKISAAGAFLGNWWAQYGDGSMAWADGVGGAYDTNLYRGAAQRLQTDKQMRAIDGIAGKYLSAAGKTTVVDADFNVAPLDGTFAIHRDTTAAKTYVSVRANGVWTVIAGPL